MEGSTFWVLAACVLMLAAAAVGDLQSGYQTWYSFSFTYILCLTGCFLVKRIALANFAFKRVLSASIFEKCNPFATTFSSQ